MADVSVFEDCSTLTIVFDPRLKSLLQDKVAQITGNQVRIAFTDIEAGGFLAVDKNEQEVAGRKQCTLTIRVENKPTQP